MVMSLFVQARMSFIKAHASKKVQQPIVRKDCGEHQQGMEEGTAEGCRQSTIVVSRTVP